MQKGYEAVIAKELKMPQSTSQTIYVNCDKSSKNLFHKPGRGRQCLAPSKRTSKFIRRNPRKSIFKIGRDLKNYKKHFEILLKKTLDLNQLSFKQYMC